MADTEKITIMLADEDALRRDGLAAVLQRTPGFEIVSQCPDGESALNRIRELRPDIAVVDLNLPRVHGIELVRRVRGEALGTRIVILSGTADDDIIREVVRAGGDGYLLKNGPARHLIDAISYVRDGGQYFSPQLRRDGLDRHLLEENPRVENPRVPPRDENERRDESDEGTGEDRGDNNNRRRPTRESPYGRPRRPTRRTSDPQQFRERLREETDTGNLQDRDYEILGMMADGIKPILDRLDEIEGRVVQMETGDAPVPHNPRGWLNSEMAETFSGDGRGGAVTRTVQDLESRLPRMIEEAVASRFHQMAEKLQQQIEDTHVRTLETFVKNIQVKLVQRVSKLEIDMSKQAEAMHQLKEYSLRTEDNLSRLITGVDKLAQELPKRLLAPEPASLPAASESGKKARRRSSGSSRRRPVALIAGGVVVLILCIVFLPRLTNRTAAAPQALTDSPSATSNSANSPALGASRTAPRGSSASGSDLAAKLQAAQKYSDDRAYPTAEDIYKQILTTDPNNVDALKGLASVLYREDKIEESAAVLDRLPKN